MKFLYLILMTLTLNVAHASSSGCNKIWGLPESLKHESSSLKNLEEIGIGIDGPILRATRLDGLEFVLKVDQLAEINWVGLSLLEKISNNNFSYKVAKAELLPDRNQYYSLDRLKLSSHHGLDLLKISKLNSLDSGKIENIFDRYEAGLKETYDWIRHHFPTSKVEINAMRVGYMRGYSVHETYHPRLKNSLMLEAQISIQDILKKFPHITKEKSYLNLLKGKELVDPKLEHWSRSTLMIILKPDNFLLTQDGDLILIDPL